MKFQEKQEKNNSQVTGATKRFQTSYNGKAMIRE